MKTDFDKAVRHTRDVLDLKGVSHHIFYSPTTELFWKENLKILILDIEPNGYKGHGRYNVTRDDLLYWMFDEGSYRTRSIRYTIAYVKSLYDGFYKRRIQNEDSFRQAYHDKDSLIKTLDKICYYYIRPFSYQVKSKKTSSILDGQNEIAKCVANEIQSLGADHIVVSGNQQIQFSSYLLLNAKTMIYPNVYQFNDQLISFLKKNPRLSYPQSKSILEKSLELLIPTKGIQNL
jgi:hypothetical protein